MPAFLADNVSKLHQNDTFSCDFPLVDAWIMTLKNELRDLFLNPTSSHFILTLPRNMVHPEALVTGIGFNYMYDKLYNGLSRSGLVCKLVCY